MSENLIIEKLVPQEDKSVQWVPYRYTFEPEKDFLIDPENLDGEICKVGQLMLQYGEARSLLDAQAERYKRDIERIHAHCYLEYRKVLLQEGERATNEVIKAHVVTNNHYQKAVQKYIEVSKQSNLAEGWWRMIQKKADLLQSIVYKQGAEIKRGAF